MPRLSVRRGLFVIPAMMDGAPRGLLTCCAMLVKQSLSISDIRVPAKRGKTLDAAKRDLLAEDLIEHGQTTPIQVRSEGSGYILVEGLHRLEALRLLGEIRIDAYLVRARQH